MAAPHAADPDSNSGGVTISCTAATDYQIPTLEKGIEVLLPECICLATT